MFSGHKALSCQVLNHTEEKLAASNASTDSVSCSVMDWCFAQGVFLPFPINLPTHQEPDQAKHKVNIIDLFQIVCIKSEQNRNRLWVSGWRTLLTLSMWSYFYIVFLNARPQWWILFEFLHDANELIAINLVTLSWPVLEKPGTPLFSQLDGSEVLNRCVL